MIENIVRKIASQFQMEFAALMAFIEVESGGRGFDPGTGKILIQFEPAWFKKKVPYAPSGKWSLNRVEKQKTEWIAFNDAFAINPVAAMESTSIGLGQIMGFHWRRLGYASVGKMWDDAKAGIERQIWQLVKFIQTDQALQRALILKKWSTVATIYNGPNFRGIAVKYNREPYDVSMEKAYSKYSLKANN